MPIIDRDGNNDNKPDINKIADYTIKTGGITFRIGAFILALIRFVLLLFMLFIIALVIIKVKK
jgi:large-conductance mechanosensitive channel